MMPGRDCHRLSAVWTFVGTQRLAGLLTAANHPTSLSLFCNGLDGLSKSEQPCSGL
jgi:hypothetical protein